MTSIARPLEPAYRTNLAVLIIVPVVALLAAGLSMAGLHAAATPVRAAMTTALAAFGAWALTRELAPDDNPAAFVSLVLAILACILAPVESLLPLFVTLFLVRIVNRTTGLAATAIDTLLVAGFAGWVAWRLGMPLIAVAGAAAFVLDAIQPNGNARSWLAAFVLGVFGLALLAAGPGVTVVAGQSGLWWGVVIAITVSYAFVIFRTDSVTSTGDATNEPLSPARVRCGMGVAGLVAFCFLVRTDPAGLPPDLLIFACLAGVVAGAATRR